MLTTTDLFTLSIVLVFPECFIVEIKQYVALLDWLFFHLELIICIQVSSVPFPFLKVHFILALKKMFNCLGIPVYLFFHLLKDILS